MLLNDPFYQLITTFVSISSVFHTILFNLKSQVYKQLTHFSFFQLVNNTKQPYQGFYLLLYLTHKEYQLSIRCQAIILLIFWLYIRWDIKRQITLIDNIDTSIYYWCHYWVFILLSHRLVFYLIHSDYLNSYLGPLFKRLVQQFFTLIILFDKYR